MHYAYAQHGAGSDKGDIYYVRSTDNGATWSTPLRLDGDGGTRGQWQPSLAVTPEGHVFVSWYDQRNTANNDLQRFGRLSLDNGATWEAPAAVSDVIYPLPLTGDPNIQPCYTGDYDRSYGTSNTIHTTWVDGRVLINGAPQQDVFYDRITTTGRHRRLLRLRRRHPRRRLRHLRLRLRTAWVERSRSTTRLRRLPTRRPASRLV